MTSPLTMKSSAVFRHALPAAALALGLALLPGLTGCGLVAAGTGAGVVAYIEGTLEVNIGTDYSKVVTATQTAVKELEFTKVSEKKDALKAEFISRTALDKKVEINLIKAGDRVTKIQIHVGFIGDQDMSLAILDKIKRGL
jgi:hypothetical protein